MFIYANVLDYLLKKEQIQRKERELLLLAACHDHDVALSRTRLFPDNLSIEEKRRHRRTVPTHVLNDPGESAWAALYRARDDQAMITTTGFDVLTFDYILGKFKETYYDYSPHGKDGKIVKRSEDKRGRRRLVNAEACLGLYLVWTRTTCKLWLIQYIFNLSHQSLSIYLRYARRVLLQVLKYDENAIIWRPSVEEIEEFKRVIAEKYPLIGDAFCFMDGLKIPIEKAGDIFEQNYFYNGWTHGHYITNIFVFVPNGTIMLAAINVPGNTHDSSMARDAGIYETLENIYQETGGKCVVDSAFNLKGQKADYLYKSSQVTDITNDPMEHARNAQATAVRQAAEWGMGSLQSGFPRLSSKLRYERDGERQLIIKSIILLHNLRCRKVGVNQINNVFEPFLERDVVETFGIQNN